MWVALLLPAVRVCHHMCWRASTGLPRGQALRVLDPRQQQASQHQAATMCEAPCVAAAPADFYGASALLPLTDAEVVDRLKSHIETCEPGFRDAKVIDSAVLRFPKAVTHFSPGSYPSRPYQVTGLGNTFIAGDWVKGVSSNQGGGTCTVQCGACMCTGNESVAARLGRTQHGSMLYSRRSGCSRVCGWDACVCVGGGCMSGCVLTPCLRVLRPAGLSRCQRPEPGACVRDWPDRRQPGH